MKKRLIPILSALLTVALLAVAALAVGATSTTPELSIEYCTLSFENTVHIWYAVDSNLENESNVKLLVWTDPQKNGYTKGTEKYVLEPQKDKEEINGEYYTAFAFDKLAAKQMTDVVYARAYVEVNGKGYYSSLNKYSILQYAYSKLGKLNGSGAADEKLKTALETMLEYGAATQELFEYKTEYLATADWHFITVSGGVLDDGAKHGLYLEDEKITITASATDGNGGDFIYWIDGTGNLVSNRTTVDLIVGIENVNYTAVYHSKTSESGLTFELSADGESYYVSGISENADKNVVIPSKWNNKPVTAIGESAFKDRTDIVGVVIPDSVTTVGSYAFNGCSGLKHLLIGDSVTTVGEGAFKNMTALTSLIIGDRIDSLDHFELDYNKVLQSVVMGSGIETIGERTFLHNYALKNVIIGKNVKTIGKSAFSNCTALEKLVIPKGVTDIGDKAFYNCNSLTSITIPEGVQSIGISAFEKCESLTHITFPDSVTKLGSAVLDECRKLTTLTLGKGITKIEGWLVARVSLLNKVYYTGTVNDWVNIEFTDHDCNPMWLGAALYIEGKLVEDLVIPNGTEQIGNHVFYGCTSIKSVVIPSSVTSIGNNAFGNCENLDSVYFHGIESEKNITFGNSKGNLETATWYYYSETQPTESGNFWHYVDGVPTVWTAD